MSVARPATDLDLTCPLCGAGVPATAAACRDCHLPISDVRRHSTPARGRVRGLARGVGVRLSGLALYAALVAWCVWQLPAALPFVAPAAVAGLVLHGIKARPWWGGLAFVVLVLGLPVLLGPALRTGAFSDLARWINDPQWW